MRCETCLLQSPEAAGLSAADLVARLDRCGACPLLDGTAPAPPGVTALLHARLREAMAEGRRQANKLRRAAHALEELQGEIARSDERVAKLETLHAQSTREADAELRQKIDLVERQQAAILALATPIIQVWDGVLVLPLIGLLDPERMELLTSHLLNEIEARRARHAILELTGISSLDEASAQHLQRVIQAASLLGAEVLLCGLRAEVARTLAEQTIDLKGTRVARNLQQALVGCVQAAARR